MTIVYIVNVQVLVTLVFDIPIHVTNQLMTKYTTEIYLISDRVYNQITTEIYLISDGVDNQITTAISLI